MREMKATKEILLDIYQNQDKPLSYFAKKYNLHLTTISKYRKRMREQGLDIKELKVGPVRTVNSIIKEIKNEVR